MTKIFVTGHQGYIGAHLVELLRQSGYQVTGCDINLYAGCSWEPLTQPHTALKTDFRHLSDNSLKGYDCLIHLAALSNDPMGDLNPALTHDINGDSAIALAAKAKKAGIPRFLFASSCSIYGKGEKQFLNEEDPIVPLSAYAYSKIAAEQGIKKLADNTFSPAFLRCATAYGHSPMLRIDLVVNNLLSCAIACGNIRIMSDGTPWRPLIHCKDIARAFIAFLEAPRETIHNQAVNIGSNTENYQVKDIVHFVQHLVPHATALFTGETGADPRNYCVSFDRLSALLPQFRLEYTLKQGMEELYQKYLHHNFNRTDFDGDKFVRLRTLKNRLELL